MKLGSFDAFSLKMKKSSKKTYAVSRRRGAKEKRGDETLSIAKSIWSAHAL